jgi:transketolase
MIANRVVYGATLLELAMADPRIVIVDSDISKPLNYTPFIKQFPERHFDCGIAEQNMISVAVGLSTCGLIPFAASFAVFTSMRALDQVRNGACLNNLNVKIIGTHAGIETGQDGATHQSVEDIAIMRSLPNMKILVPSTPNMTRRLTKLAAYTDGPVYLRFGREPNREFYNDDEEFCLGGSKILSDGDYITVITCGNLLQIAVEAAKYLQAKGIFIRVIDMYSIKPIDIDAIIQAAKDTRGIITIEDHSIIGGLGSAVCEVCAQHYPAKIRRMGVNDVFGRSGSASELFAHYGLTADNIVQAVESFIFRY